MTGKREERRREEGQGSKGSIVPHLRSLVSEMLRSFIKHTMQLRAVNDVK